MSKTTITGHDAPARMAHASTTPPVVRQANFGGRSVVVIERTPPLPSTLDDLLRRIFGVRVRNDIRPTGTSTSCVQFHSHRFDVLREGRYFGPDRILRDLRVQMCCDCGAVCVRDVTIDRSNGGLNRRDLILGWYAGKAVAGRTHL